MLRSLVPLVAVGLFLIVVFTEGQKQDFKHAIACEGDEVQLNKCPTRSVIKVDSAMFGRKRTYFCKGRANYTTLCGLVDVKHRVKAMCNERNKCSFRADTNLLGEVEQCLYVAKYIDIYYTCVPTNDIGDECMNPVVQYDPHDTDNRVLTVKTSRDDGAKFSVKFNNSVATNQQEFFFLIICVIGAFCVY